MDFETNGVTVSVNPNNLSDEQLIGLAQEVADAAYERSLEMPLAAGAVAVDGAMQAEAEPVVEAPTPDTKESLSQQLTV